MMWFIFLFSCNTGSKTPKKPSSDAPVILQENAPLKSMKIDKKVPLDTKTVIFDSLSIQYHTYHKHKIDGDTDGSFIGSIFNGEEEIQFQIPNEVQRIQEFPISNQILRIQVSDRSQAPLRVEVLPQNNKPLSLDSNFSMVEFPESCGPISTMTERHGSFCLKTEKGCVAYLGKFSHQVVYIDEHASE